MSDGIRASLVGASGAIMSFFVFGGIGAVARWGASGSSDPFDAVPKDSFIAITVDMAELRRSPIYELVSPSRPPMPAGRDGKDGALQNALGIGPLSSACGFDPLTRVRKLAIAVPEEGERGEFGLAAQVEVTRAELEKCIANVGGGSTERATPTKEIGSFVVVDSAKSSGSSKQPALAYGSGGLLVVGKGAWLETMIGAADKTKPSLREAEGHASMRASLTRREGFRAPTLVATAILPRSLRERLKGEMGAELGAPNTSPDTSKDTSSTMMAGVLGVSSVGLAIRAGGVGQNVDAAVELVCDSAEACESVDKLILKKRLEWSKELSLRLVGFGPLVDSLETHREGTRVRVTATASADALAATLERVIKLRGRKTEPPEPSPRPTPTAAPTTPAANDRKPDETVPARR